MILDCTLFQEWLDAYFDDELDSGDRQKMEQHLAGCPACRQALAEIAEIHAGLGEDAQRSDPGPEFFEELPARLEKRFDLEAARRNWRPAPLPAPPRPPWRIRFRLVQLVGAAAVLVIALGVATNLRRAGGLSRLAGKPAVRMEVPSQETAPAEPLPAGRAQVERIPSGSPGPVEPALPVRDVPSGREKPASPREPTRVSQGKVAPPAGTMELPKGEGPAEDLGEATRGEAPAAATEREQASTAEEGATWGGLNASKQRTERAPEPWAARGQTAADRLRQGAPGPGALVTYFMEVSALDAGSAKQTDAGEAPSMVAESPAGGERGGRPEGFTRGSGPGAQDSSPRTKETAWGIARSDLQASGAPDARTDETDETKIRGAGGINPADVAILLAREEDPSLPDSLWSEAWRVAARVRAATAFSSVLLEDCQDALLAYWRMGHRGGRELLPEAGARRAAYAPEQLRIERLLACVSR